MNQQGGRGRGGKKKNRDGQRRSKSPYRKPQQQQQQGPKSYIYDNQNRNQHNNYQTPQGQQQFNTPAPPQRKYGEREKRRKQQNLKDMRKQERVKFNEAKVFQLLFQSLSNEDNEWQNNYNELVQHYNPLSNFLSRLRIQDDQYLSFYNLVHIMTRKKIQDNQFLMEIMKSATFNIQVTEICSIFSQQADEVNFFQQEMEKLLKLFVWIFRGSETTFRQSCVSSIFNLQKIIECYYEKHHFTQLFNEYDNFLKTIYKTVEPIQYKNSPSYPVAQEFIQIDLKKDQQLFGKLEKLNQKNITLDKYLDYHYFVIREDYIRNLRVAISSLSETGFEQKIDRETTSNINLYQNMQLASAAMNNYEVIWGITLEQFNMDGRIQKKIDWSRSKKLSSGNLICLTNIECYPLIFGVITNRDERQPFYDKDKKIKLEFKLLDPNVLMMTFLNLFSQKTIIIEYEDLVDPIVSYLEAIKSKDYSFPFQSIIVHGGTSIVYPKYLSKGYQWQIDLSNNRMYGGAKFNIFQEPWPKQQCTLDQSQQEAIKLILRKEVALIQGPPGTGKTFCGALAVRILVENLNQEDFPIMIVCYTNHALDQFLEHIIKFVPIADVARLGGSCKNQELKECQFRCQTQIRDFEWDKFKLLKSQIYDILDRKLTYNYKVSSKDIKYTWPELWDRLISQFLENNHLSEDHLDKQSEHEIVTCWLERKKPTEDMLAYQAFLNGMHDYYTKKRISIDIQIKKFLKKETSQIIQKRSDSSDEDLDVYMDSEDEPMYRNNLYMDESPKEINKKITDAIKEFNKYYQNSDDLYYDYEGIQRIRIEIKGGNPWLMHEKDIKEIIRYIKCLKYQEDSVQFDRIYKEFQEMSQQLKALYDQNEILQLNEKKIIGVTIAGVARQVKKLQKLNTKVMIIEEAAEVLESHIVSVLTPNLQHLILIGDHQQLKPKLKCYELEIKMDANVSLFEKLFKNKIPSVTLSQQRRMKPSFADFIRLIYGPTYQDHVDTVKKQKIEIKGIIQDVVFFNHKWLETSQETSKENKKEADMIFSMVQYLLNMGYDQSEISVLTLYLRQAQTIKKRFFNAKQMKIKVQTVDNYQGEENEIVILSLVRNNLNRQLGYIKIENRINVALSRAKHGLYVFGNFDFIYENSETGSLWQKVINLAKQKNCLQNSIKVKCLQQSHIIDICNPEDWERARQGKCQNRCEKRFQNCTHLCKKMCHPGEHPAQNCSEKCDRLIDCGHKCTKLCKEKCLCTTIVNLGLSCGHSVQAVCGTDPYTINCQTEQEAFFKKCAHSVKYQCYQRQQYIYQCNQACEKVLQCGHKCQKICYEECQPCKQVCRKQRPCGHQSQCTKLCFEPCSPCTELVNYQLKCGHSQQFKCGSLQQDLKNYRCEQPCKLQSKCNHQTQCTKKCYEKCSVCTILIECDLGCGHKSNFPCNSWYQDIALYKCKADCIKARPCGHQTPCTKQCYEVCSPCIASVPATFQCGHTQQFNCANFEQQKRNYRCVKNCQKQRACGHQSECTKLCSEPCSPCTTIVNYQLKCGHIQQFTCGSLQEDLKNFRCEQPCKQQSNCNHKTLCTRKCYENCSICTIQVACDLGCGHKQSFPCNTWYQDIARYQCKAACLKERPCGHQDPCIRYCYEICSPCQTSIPATFQCGHTKSFACSSFEEQKRNFQCNVPCQKNRQCGHKDPCQNVCYQTCSPCQELLDKTLDCGHKFKVKCSDFKNLLKCDQKCIKKRECGHDFPCNEICSNKCSPCEMPLSVQLACGHTDNFKCHSKLLDLQNYKCKKICEKERICGHKYPCENLCYQNCSPCLQQVIQTLNCGHFYVVNCCDFNKPIICQQKCIKERLCGHNYPCSQKCSSNCDSCKMKVSVKIECQHEVQVECYNKTTFLLNYVCRDACNKPRLCGHNYPCNNLCYLKKECTPCFANVKKTLKCGHEADIQCFQKQLNVLSIDCKQPCKKPRVCGHDYPCEKLCFEGCTPCGQIVEKPQPCGHKLKLQCSFTEIVQCTMPCIKKRDCGHQYPCSKRCYEYCSPCGHVLTRKLPCGHNQDVTCNKKHLNIPCQQPCVKLRECGHKHPCANQCSSRFCSPCETMVQKFCSNCFGTRMVKCHLLQTSECDLPIKVSLKCSKHSIYVKCCLSKQADLKCKECGDCVIF